jgi:hypothetical protein
MRIRRRWRRLGKARPREAGPWEGRGDGRASGRRTSRGSTLGGAGPWEGRRLGRLGPAGAAPRRSCRGARSCGWSAVWGRSGRWMALPVGRVELESRLVLFRTIARPVMATRSRLRVSRRGERLSVAACDARSAEWPTAYGVRCADFRVGSRAAGRCCAWNRRHGWWTGGPRPLDSSSRAILRRPRSNLGQQDQLAPLHKTPTDRPSPASHLTHSGSPASPSARRRPVSVDGGGISSGICRQRDLAIPAMFHVKHCVALISYVARRRGSGGQRPGEGLVLPQGRASGGRGDRGPRQRSRVRQKTVSSRRRRSTTLVALGARVVDLVTAARGRP